MNETKRKRRIRQVLAEGNPLGWWYLSFADEKQFLGAVIVQAHGIGDATAVAHQRGINPGGEVMGVPARGDFNPPEAFTNRLLSKTDLADMERAMGGRQ